MDLAVTSNDVYLTNGDLTLVSDQGASIAQLLGQTLQFFMGEWFIDQSLGLPYWQSLLGKNPNPLLIDSVLKLAALSTPGIDQLLAFSTQIDTKARKLIIVGTFLEVGNDEAVDFNVSIGL